MTSRETEAPGIAPGSWEWTVDTPDRWMLVPSAGSASADALREWEEIATAAVRDSLDPDLPSDDEATGELAAGLSVELDRMAEASVTNLRAFADAMADGGHHVVAIVGLMGRSPVPVLVTVGISDPAAPDEDLMTALGATGGLPVSPPKVEYPELPDGDGVRVTRLDLGEVSGGAWVSVALGRRTEHPDAVVDTVLVWRSQDIFLGAAMTEALDELLPTVQVTPVKITRSTE